MALLNNLFFWRYLSVLSLCGFISSLFLTYNATSGCFSSRFFYCRDQSFLDRSLYNNFTDPRKKSKIVEQYRALMEKLALPGDRNLSQAEVSHLPSDLLLDARLSTYVERFRQQKLACENSPYPKELTKGISNETTSAGTEVFIQDDTHHLSICLNAKAAANSLIMYAKVLGVSNVLNHLLSQLKTKKTANINIDLQNMRIKNLFQTKKKYLDENNLKVVLVRHPFKRLVAAYADRVFNRKIPENTYNSAAYKLMLKLSETLTGNKSLIEIVLQKSGFNSSQIPIQKLPCNQLFVNETNLGANKETTRSNVHGQKVPSFRGFVLRNLRSIMTCNRRVNCLNNLDRHVKPQSVRCGPCVEVYDVIVKVETLKEDMQFIEHLLGMEDAWRLQEEVLDSREEGRVEPEVEQEQDKYQEEVLNYQEHMTELRPSELDLLYTAFYNDFNLFGYDPCEDL